MFIPIGRLRRRRGLGVVAEWCPVCEAVEKFHLRDVRTHWHVYWVALPPGKPEGLEVECPRCGFVDGGEEGQYRPATPRVAGQTDAPGLIEPTNPRLMDRLDGLLARADTAPPTQPEVRQAEMRQTLGLLEPALRLRMSRMEFGAASWVLAGLAALSFGSIVAMAVLIPRAQRAAVRPIAGVALLVAIVCALLAIWLAASAWRGYVKDRARPALARRLARLRPTIDEWRELKRWGRKNRLRVSQAIDPAAMERLTRRLDGR